VAHIQELDVIALTWFIWQQLQLHHHLTLEINNIGTSAERALYLQDLVAFFKQCDLNQEQQATLAQNPLRLLETKDPLLQAQLHTVPLINAYYTIAQQAELDQLHVHVSSLGIPVHINHLLVRGLDYYTGNVFEWRIRDVLGAQDTLCAGGRYDGLFQALKSQKSVKAFGCAFGIERILLALEALHLLPQQPRPWTVYLFSDEASAALAVKLRAEISRYCAHAQVILNWQARSMKAHFDKGIYVKAKIMIQLAAGQLSYTYPTQKEFQLIAYQDLITLIESSYSSYE
jgi:histidyl-tRNA synthetase